MGLFGRKRRMIDVRELQRRGMTQLPIIETDEVITDKDGFVEMGTSSTKRINSFQAEPIKSSGLKSPSIPVSSNSNFFGFMDTPKVTPPVSSFVASNSVSSRTTPSEDLRRISQQISDLDNKLYKMEQRIDVLERKVGVGDSGNMW